MQAGNIVCMQAGNIVCMQAGKIVCMQAGKIVCMQAGNGGASAPSKLGDPEHMKSRTLAVQQHMPGAIAADDYLSRCEVMLCAHGFRGDNTIGVSNLCRDESTGILKSKIEAIFGANFNINGLGAVLTCGATGVLPFPPLPLCLLCCCCCRYCCCVSREFWGWSTSLRC